MSGSKDKQITARGKKKAPSRTARKATPPQDLPDPESIIAEVPFTSPKGNTYRIIITDETDPYDEPTPPKMRTRKRGK